MTVAELIDKLMKYPPQWDVVFNSGDALHSVYDTSTTRLWSNQDREYKDGVALS